DAIRQGLASFPGADRRFEEKGQCASVRGVDDYGHHPTEIRAVLEAARRVAGGGRVVVLFQPHRYTRVAALMDAFAEVLAQADLLLVSDIYAASESPIRGVSGKELVRRIRGLGHSGVRHCPRVEDMAGTILPALRPGDLVITLGAGHITTVGERLLALLEGRNED
ncbi:MAG: cyanophycin synthetase, partial [Acidobacteriota bacterium]